MRNLADLLDRLHRDGGALLSESDQVVTISALTVESVRQIVPLCQVLDWPSSIVDEGDNEWSLENLRAEYAPFRVILEKPPSPPDTLQLLTLIGFERHLRERRPYSRWHIAKWPEPFATHSILISSWGDQSPFEAAPVTKNPRSLVREAGGERLVPPDIRPWLWAHASTDLFQHEAYRVWANEAARNIIISLSDELDAEDGSLKFRGPPRLSLPAISQEANVLTCLTPLGFHALQDAAAWVFESEREAEMRHILLSTELARSRGEERSAISFVSASIADALTGAKIAYQMSLAELSRDTLKALGELRKAVTDETSKVTEATRQTITAVASALAIGLGLLAARLTTAVNPLLLKGVMVVAGIYVLSIILSGRQFILLQRKLRLDWQSRLYRFLPQGDYDQMVGSPTRRAEDAFAWAASLGGLATLGLGVMIFLVSPTAGSTNSLPRTQRPATVSPTASTPTPTPTPTPTDNDNATGNLRIFAPAKPENSAD